jgi:hypothetical protein
MKHLLTLTKRGSRIEVMQDGGLICFCYGDSHKEWIIKPDLERFTQFLTSSGYKRKK